MAIHLGVDFGTSTTRVSLAQGAPKAPIPLEIGDPSFGTNQAARFAMPSVVAYEKDISGIPIVYKVGEEAAVLDPRDKRYFVVREIKRLLLSSNDEGSMEPEHLPEEWDVASGVVDVWDSQIPAEEIAKAIVSEAMERATKELNRLGYHSESEGGLSFSVGIPARAGGKDRATLMNIMEDSGISGLDPRNVVEEPVLALIPHFIGRNIQEGELLLVCDIGGGTTDIAILRFESESQGRLKSEVGIVHGRKFLGGSDIDAGISNHIIERIAIANDVDLESVQDLLSESPEENRLLKTESIRVKEGLSTASEIRVDRYLTSMLGETAEIVITQDDLSEILRTTRFINNVKDCIRESIYVMDAIDNGGFTVKTDDSGGFKFLPRKNDDAIKIYFDKVFLAGGSCSMPIIRDSIADFLTSDGRLGDPDQLVFAQLATALGAAESTVLDFTASFSQPPFDVWLTCDSNNSWESLYHAYDVAYQIDALNKGDTKSYKSRFKRLGTGPHKISITHHGELRFEKVLELPLAFSEGELEIDIYGRCKVRFGMFQKSPEIILDFEGFQTKRQLHMLNRFLETNESQRQEEQTNRDRLLDHRADRDNNA